MIDTDCEGTPLKIGDEVWVRSGDCVSWSSSSLYAGTVTGFDDQFIRVDCPILDYHGFGKYQHNIKLKLDPDLRVDIGL